MYSRDETIDAVLRLYRQVIKHPYINDNVLILPPLNGWDSINIQGKNGTVLDLLHHLPYLHLEKPYERLLIHWETIPICYSDPNSLNTQEEVYPLPAHCVYLTHSLDREGISLILDTHEGTISEFSNTGSHIVVPYEEYEALPESENWKAHRTTPVIELLDSWTRKYENLIWMLVPNTISQPTTGRFYSRAESSVEEDELLQQGQLEPWHPEDDDSYAQNYDQESEFDRSWRETRIRAKRHAADVYNTYLRYGWPDHFDKDRCRVELLELERTKDAEDRRLMDEANPDAALFD
ncbi:hypothetical protein F4781DRAFT_59856 [Annulohypoxylon bovei var. microspora]|nr:hypothetical protein F4781DRAFT_59856 [Annulohypoxylon bovei var. microspora]